MICYDSMILMNEAMRYLLVVKAPRYVSISSYAYGYKSNVIYYRGLIASLECQIKCLSENLLSHHSHRR